MVDALVRGLQKHGGRLLLRSHVEEITTEGGKATGVGLGWCGAVRCGVACMEGSALGAGVAAVVWGVCWAARLQQLAEARLPDASAGFLPN
jgi:hypothetical protein